MSCAFVTSFGYLSCSQINLPHHRVLSDWLEPSRKGLKVAFSLSMGLTTSWLPIDEVWAAIMTLSPLGIIEETVLQQYTYKTLDSTLETYICLKCMFLFHWLKGVKTKSFNWNSHLKYVTLPRRPCHKWIYGPAWVRLLWTSSRSVKLLRVPN